MQILEYHTSILFWSLLDFVLLKNGLGRRETIAAERGAERIKWGHLKNEEKIGSTLSVLEE